MHYTYVLQSNIDGKFYVGFTKNLKLRFEQHRKGLPSVPMWMRHLPLDARLLRSMHRRGGRNQTRKVSQNIPWKDVLETQAQILFNRVKGICQKEQQQPLPREMPL
jgi:hypothetical protein